jgi:hypothetical protein
MNTLDTFGLLARLQAMHRELQDALREHIESAALEEMAREDEVRAGDTIYAIDSRGEEILLPFCEAWGRDEPFLLVAEGLHEAGSSLPPGHKLFGCTRAEDARFILICDPIDGTRPLMYAKRSAWILSAIAPNRGAQTSLQDIEVALQTEIPTRKAARADAAWAIRGEGTQASERNFYTGEERLWTPRPSGAPSARGGFASLAKFFPGAKGWIANLEEDLVSRALGEPDDGQPLTFDDQYICNGGQLFELATGRDRFNGDIRPLAHKYLHGSADARLCSHPYDLCCELVAREAGVSVTNLEGGPLDSPLDVSTAVGWLGYANASIQSELEPALLEILKRYR